MPFTCTFYEKEGARASCQHVTLRNCRGLPATTTTVKNGNDLLEEPAQAFTQWARPDPCSNRLHHGSTAMARHPGRAMALQTYPPSSYRLHGLPRAANDPEMFSVADRQEKDTTPPSKQLRCMYSRFSTPSHTLHEKDCNSRIYGGLTHFPHIHQQCRLDTWSTNIKINTCHQNGFRPDTGKTCSVRDNQTGKQEATRTEGIVQDTVENVCWPTSFVTHLLLARAPRPRPHLLSLWSNRARQSTTAERQSDNVGKADKDSTRFLNFSHTTRPSMNVFQYHTKFTTVSA